MAEHVAKFLLDFDLTFRGEHDSLPPLFIIRFKFGDFGLSAHFGPTVIRAVGGHDIGIDVFFVLAECNIHSLKITNKAYIISTHCYPAI